ncbi:MAG TPA: hypothetical protein VGM37_06705 [Armatimonadota bacterium]|jgi:anti-sigma factor RsiW
MSAKMTCERFREGIDDARSGRMDAALQRSWEAHRATCAACQAEVARDAWLCDALSRLPAEPPLPVSWSQVLAARRPDRRRSRLRPALGFAAAALAGLLLVHPFGRKQPPAPLPPPTAAVQGSGAGAYDGAHALVSMFDMGADPNRAAILVYGAPAGARGGS